MARRRVAGIWQYKPHFLAIDLGKPGTRICTSDLLLLDELPRSMMQMSSMVLAGHGRLEAARLEGLAKVPVIRFDHLTAAQTRAYVIADNKLAEQWRSRLG
jgi:hypothetical protein